MAQNLIHSLLLAISIIVVAVPEGLPMMITVVLSSNMMRMQRAGVMVRKLVGIETAGSLNLLFTDKTGTLTQNKMTVVEHYGDDEALLGRAMAQCSDAVIDAEKKEYILYHIFL